ncbi:replication protein [Arsenophonus sp.]|uniref:replication protein n=1 Tax=Arsenophonus sp. TaxID=1872640 RepID=UPI0038798883
MTNVAYADFEAQKKCNEPRVVEIENGYIRLANELYEALIIADLTKNQAKVAHAICRKTYGFNKKTDRITDIQISELTNLPRQKVNKAKNELIAMKVIVKNGFKIGINKNISDWVMPNCHQNSDRLNPSPKQGQCHQNSDKTVTKTVTHSGCHQSNDSVTKTGTKSVTETVTAMSPKQGHTKDTITKDNKNNKTHSQLPLTSNRAKPERRKPNHLDCEAYLNAYNEIVGDRLPHAVEASNERKRKLKLLVESLVKPNLEGFQDYVTAFMERARPFHFGDNDRGWVATFDFLLNRKTLTKIREGTL